MIELKHYLVKTNENQVQFNDEIKNQDEDGIDCGGPCSACGMQSLHNRKQIETYKCDKCIIW